MRMNGQGDGQGDADPLESISQREEDDLRSIVFGEDNEVSRT